MMKGALLMLLATVLQVPSVESLYSSARAYDKATFRFEPPSPARTDAARTLAQSLTQEALDGASEPSRRARVQAGKLGLELTRARDGAGPLWVLHEAGERRAGDGFYVWRPHGVPLCVQAPHSFFDEGTGDIALRVFAETKAVALFINTVHRYAPGVTEGAADLAHAPRSLFQAATEGLLAARLVAVVQIHGFGPRDGLPADASAVVSDGAKDRLSDAPAVQFRANLAGAFSGRVLLYGVDARELGATTNVQGKTARRAGATFLHVELAQDVRAAKPGPASALARALVLTLSLPK